MSADFPLFDAWMRTAREAEPEIIWMATDGHCDAFALALTECLNEHFPHVSNQLVVISRKRVALDDPSEVEEETPLSHVLVKMGPHLVDVNGIDADERWEENWVQPFERAEHGFGENEDLEDLFSYQSMSEPELRTLRQTHSKTPVHAGHQARFKTILLTALAKVHPEIVLVDNAMPRRRRRP